MLVLHDSRTGEVDFAGQRVTRRLPCPVCAHLHREPSWCLVDVERGLAICPRVESPRRIGDAGWLHQLDGAALPRWNAAAWRRDAPAPSAPVPQEALEARWRRAESRATRASAVALADALGLPAASVETVPHGIEDGAWLFPMQGADGRLCGIKTRHVSGRKLCVRGSRLGLIVPRGFDRSAREVWITEGESDLMAVAGLGLNAVARPGCTACTGLLARLCAGREAVILADRDEAGRRGANALSDALSGSARSVNIVTVPPPAKDARAWVIAGAGREDLSWRLASARGW